MNYNYVHTQQEKEKGGVKNKESFATPLSPSPPLLSSTSTSSSSSSSFSNTLFPLLLQTTGDAKRYNTADDDNFSQVGTFWRKVLSEEEKTRLVQNIAGHLKDATEFIQHRAVSACITRVGHTLLKPSLQMPSLVQLLASHPGSRWSPTHKKGTRLQCNMTSDTTTGCYITVNLCEERFFPEYYVIVCMLLMVCDHTHLTAFSAFSAFSAWEYSPHLSVCSHPNTVDEAWYQLNCFLWTCALVDFVSHLCLPLLERCGSLLSDTCPHSDKHVPSLVSSFDARRKAWVRGQTSTLQTDFSEQHAIIIAIQLLLLTMDLSCTEGLEHQIKLVLLSLSLQVRNFTQADPDYGGRIAKLLQQYKKRVCMSGLGLETLGQGTRSATGRRQK